MEAKAATCTGDIWKPKLLPAQVTDGSQSCHLFALKQLSTVHILEEENKEEFDTSTNEEIVKANVNLYV